jgi:hypothetical protein
MCVFASAKKKKKKSKAVLLTVAQIPELGRWDVEGKEVGRAFQETQSTANLVRKERKV